MKQPNCASDHTPLSLQTRQRTPRVKSPLHHAPTWHGTWLCRWTTFCMNGTLIIMHKLSGYHNKEHLNKKNICVRTSVVKEALNKMCVYLGTPWVMFMDATPAKWKVFRVICVPGSPILCAARAPTAVPAKWREWIQFLAESTPLNNCKQKTGPYCCSFKLNTKFLHLSQLEMDINVIEEHAASNFRDEG